MKCKYCDDHYIEDDEDQIKFNQVEGDLCFYCGQHQIPEREVINNDRYDIQSLRPKGQDIGRETSES